MALAASADAVGTRPYRSACGSRRGEVRPRVSSGDAEGHLGRGARARARTTALLCEPRIPPRPWNAPYPTRPPPARLHPLHAAPAQGRWTFRSRGRAMEVPVRGRLVVNSIPLATEAAARGLGIVRLPRAAVIEGLAANQLVEVLDAYAPPARPFYAVHASGGRVAPPARRVLESANKHLEGKGG